MAYPPVPNKNRSTAAGFTGVSETIYVPLGFVYDYQKSSYVTNTLVEEAHTSNHSGWKSAMGGRQDVGGPFFVYRNEIIGKPTPFKGTYDTPDNIFHHSLGGDCMPIGASLMGDFPPPKSGSKMDMDRDGASAVAKAAPGTSPMNLAVALGELKNDGLPSIVGSTLKQRTSVAKKAGDEYLNAQFGWKPLVNDVKSLANTITSADSILNQLERDAGKTVRRRLTLYETDETSKAEKLFSSPAFVGGLSRSDFDLYWEPGYLCRTKRTYKKVWFSGSFTYYLPPNYYSRDAVRRAAARSQLLYGTKLTPTVLWNLAPWSWAADWFSNAGDVISNTTRFLTEGLVMHHGYLMEHTVHDYTYWNDSPSCPAPTITLRTETKARVKANPFGFGTDFSSLNGFQVSILAALGMSRGG